MPGWCQEALRTSRNFSRKQVRDRDRDCDCDCDFVLRCMPKIEFARFVHECDLAETMPSEMIG